MSILVFILKPIKLTHLMYHLNEIWFQFEVVHCHWRTNNTRPCSLEVWSCIVRDTVLVLDHDLFFLINLKTYLH